MTATQSSRSSVARRVAPDLPLPPAVADLTASRPLFARLSAELSAELDSVIARLKSSEVKVTFGGRFKTGKSSLIDAALGERLLPTGDLPETGVSCHVRHGTRRTAALVGPSHREQMACDTAALRKAVTLRGSNERVEQLGELKRVDIELPEFPGGPDAVWIDPPGLFDVDAMTERARVALEAADVVVWVLRSQQFLGEAEMGEIAERVGRRGWAGLVFVENAYLRTGHPDPWAEHMTEIAPVNRDKLRHHADDMGFPAPPAVLSVSAEMVLTRGPDAPGGRELLGLLKECGRANNPRVIAARYQWLHRILGEYEARLSPVHAKLKKANDDTEKENAKAANTDLKRRAELTGEVEDAVSEFVSGFESSVTGSAAGLAAAISTADYKTDDTYDAQLKATVQAEFARAADALFARLDDKLRRWGVGPLSGKKRQRLRENLAPTDCPVSAANTSGKTGTGTAAGAAAGALAGAAIGSVVPVIGTGVGAVIGGLGGAFFGNKKQAEAKLAADVAKTKGDIGTAAAATAASVTGKRADIRKAVKAAYLKLLPEPAEEMVDRGEELEYADALDRVRKATAVCEREIDNATMSLTLEVS